MNRPKFLPPLGEHRHPRRHRRRGAAHAATVIPAASATTLLTTEPIAITVERPLSHDVRRAQAAGGPIDHASYNCACGYLFSADVSTSVTCPHCGTAQAW
jgi:hypothetical protein